MPVTISGNFLHLNNHTNDDGTAGDQRGASVGSSSGHILEMIDKGNEEPIPFRQSGGVPTPRSKAASVSLRSGGKLELKLCDGSSQTETADQYAYLYVPQVSNPNRPAHMLRMQARAEGPGQVLMQVGGDYICNTYDTHETIVGVETNPSNKITKVTKNDIHSTEGSHIHTAKEHRLISDQPIQLLAGTDKKVTDHLTGKTTQVPNVFPVVVWDPARGLVISDRLYGTASQTANQVSASEVLPFTAGQTDTNEDVVV